MCTIIMVINNTVITLIQIQYSCYILIFIINIIIRPLLQKLHWLPISSRIQCKVATLCYNSFTESYPVCLSELSISIQTTLLYFWHKNLPHTFHKNKTLWTAGFFFHGPDSESSDTVEIVTIWCLSLSISIFFQHSSKPYPPPPPPPCVCECDCVCAICCCTFLLQYNVHLYYIL